MDFKVGQIVRVKPLGDRFDFTIEARIEAILKSGSIYESKIVPSGNSAEFDLFSPDGTHILDLSPDWYFSSLRDEKFWLSGQMSWVIDPDEDDAETHEPSFDQVEISIEVIDSLTPP